MKQDNKTIMSPRRGSRFERHRVARILAVQAVFEARSQGIPFSKMTQRFLKSSFPRQEHPVAPDSELFTHLMATAEARGTQIQDILNASLVGDWQAAWVDPVVIAVLTVGLSELFEPFQDRPKPVVISEYVQICQGFLSPKEAGYVNKVLDKIAHTLAPQAFERQ